MPNEIMHAMVERTPKKARAIQKRGKGKLRAYATKLVDQAEAEIEAQNVPTDDLNRRRMVREVAMDGAMQEALFDHLDDSN